MSSRPIEKFDRTNPRNLDGIIVQKTKTITINKITKTVRGRELTPKRETNYHQNPFPDDFDDSSPINFKAFNSEPSTPIQQKPMKTSNGSTERKIAFALGNLYSDSNVNYDTDRVLSSSVRKLFN